MSGATPNRKYMSEFAVNLCSARWMAVTPAELASGGRMAPETAELSSLCHIYLITRRPSSSFNPSQFSYNGSEIEGEILYKVNGKTKAVPFKLPFQLLDGATSLEVSPYPHREIWTRNPSGEIVRTLPAYALSINSVAVDLALGRFEVLYVGQAYAEGRRSAFDRLKSHSTLQKIMADAQYRFPDDETMILTFGNCSTRVG